jgi:hypothetical protein
LRRWEMLEARCVERLTWHVRELRGEMRYGCNIPYFDPLDDGVEAKVLFLFESPGEGALARPLAGRVMRLTWVLTG